MKPGEEVSERSWRKGVAFPWLIQIFLSANCMKPQRSRRRQLAPQGHDTRAARGDPDPYGRQGNHLRR